MLRAKLFATPLFVLAALGAASSLPASAAEQDSSADVAASDVGGVTLYSNWNIVQNAAKSPLHKTLASALTTAGVAETLSGDGPFTIFAPTDAAFAAMPQPMTDWLMAPGNTESLAKMLTFHVVPGRVTADDLYKKIKAGGGKATLTTVQGETLSFTEVQGNIKVEGTQGSTGFVTQQDVEQSNGMIHVINGVLIPTFG